MTVLHAPIQPRTLQDRELIRSIRDLVAEAQTRPSCKIELRALLLDVLGEEKAELLAASNLSADEIAAVCAHDLHEVR